MPETNPSNKTPEKGKDNKESITQIVDLQKPETSESSSEITEKSSFIPKVFQNTGKPELLTLESVKNLPNSDRLSSAIASGGTVKLFELTSPVTQGQKVDAKYETQYDLNAYDKNGVRQLNVRLDAEKKAIN